MPPLAIEIKITCVFPPTPSMIAHRDKPTQAGNPSKNEDTTFPTPYASNSFRNKIKFCSLKYIK